MKPILTESRFDFRKGRNTAISPDLLLPQELVDTTNARLINSYGAFAKRSGCQRIHPDSFPAAIKGVTQWDTISGKQTVVISNGKLYYRNGTDFNAAFTEVATTGVPRTTAAQGAGAGWTLTPSSLSGPVGTDTDEVVGERPVVTVGDPAAGDNEDAADDLYMVEFDVKADGTGMSGVYAAIDASVMIEANINGGGYNDVSGPYSATASIGTQQTKHYAVAITASGVVTSLLIRLKLHLRVVGSASGNGVATATAGYPVTWATGAALFSTTEPAIFAPFRASSAGAPLVLYIASGGHYFSWNGASTLTQLDPTNSAPLTTCIIPYHTRMIAMTASVALPGQYPKTIFWSKIGDATNFNTGAKDLGGSAVTDFLTGQQLVSLEVIGSSLLMATADSVMRFQGHASDEIVISQDTEGVSAEVGVVGLLALKRFENVAAFLARRGPYAATETSCVPIGEQVLPDFDALDSANISNSVVAYHRGRKELFFAVPGASDNGLNKTIFVQAVRLQAWYGPWTYAFGINCMANYIGASGIENVIAGCSDGYVRLMDVGSLDDVLADGSGGSNITMTVEIPTMQFGRPGIIKSLIDMYLQATLPTNSALQIKHAFDGDAFTTESVASQGSAELSYRVDFDNQGSRLRMQFVDASPVIPIINGFVLNAYDYNRIA